MTEADFSLAFGEFSIPILISQCVLAAISFLVNIFAFSVYFSSLELRKSAQSLLFLSLVITSTIHAINTLLLGPIAIHSNSWKVLTGTVCQWNAFFMVGIGMVEVYTFFLLALERYCAIVRGKNIPKYFLLFLQLSCWLKSFLLASVPMWNSYYSYEISPARNYCAIAFYRPENAVLAWLNGIPMGIANAFTMWFYSNIYKAYQEHKKRRGELHMSSNTENDANSKPSIRKSTNVNHDHQVAVACFTLMSFTVVMWTPHLGGSIVFDMVLQRPPDKVYNLFASALVSIGYCCDTIILLLLDMRWRYACGQFIKRLRGKTSNTKN